MISKLLAAMTTKDKQSDLLVPFEWDDQCEQDFQTIEKALISAPVLMSTDLDKEVLFGL